jgi:two-component system cell cycle sensor histidine kinase/response regulator CckA
MEIRRNAQMSTMDHFLKDTEPLMESVFNALQDGIFILDKNFTIVRTNQWMEMKFLAKMPLINKKCHAVFRDSVNFCSDCPYIPSLESGKPHVQVLPYPSSREPVEWFEFSMFRLEDGDGKLIGAIGQVKDITERRKTLALLEDEVAQRRIMVEQSRDGIVILDQNGKVHEANQKFAHMLGYTLEEVHQLYVWDWDANWTKDQLLEKVRAVDDTGDYFETRHRRKDGTIYDVEISTNGAVYREYKLVFCVCRDITKRITEQKRVEETLRLTQFAFDKASIGIIQANEDARILNANEQACKNLDYSHTELCSMSLSDIDQGLDSDDRKALWRQLCEDGHINFVSTHRRRDGSQFPVDVTSNLLRFEGKKYSISFIRDTSEQKNEEKQKEILEAHLRKAQRMEALGALAGGIAHDFNNILSAIYSYSELAQLRCPENSKLRYYIDQISTASNRAKHLVQQILAFSRQGKSEKQIIDISSVVRESLKLIKATFPSTIDIKHHIEPNLGNLMADETQIHQVLMNLCTSAYHSMQNEVGLLEVELSSATIGTYDSTSYPILSPGKYLKLVVSDTGHGMDSDQLDHIFDPYYPTRRSGDDTGMGLSAVHGIVKDHGGSIKVYSRPGVGTTFQIFLPLTETGAPHSTAAADNLSSRMGRILLVDDETPILDSGKAFLEDLGYAIDARTSPTEALELVKEAPDRYQLIITDMIMPKMTGEKLTKEIRKIRPDMPIILWTGFSENISADTLSKIGISEVLLKPITLSHLANTVRKVLGQQEPE